MYGVFCYVYGYPRDLHVRTHSFPTPRSSDLAIGVEQEGDLVHFAAEPDHEDAGDVRMACVAPEGALQRLVAVAAVGHAAAGGAHEGGDTVAVRVVGDDAGLVAGLGAVAGNGRGAVHRREDAPFVSRAGPPAPTTGSTEDRSE